MPWQLAPHRPAGGQNCRLLGATGSASRVQLQPAHAQAAMITAVAGKVAALPCPNPRQDAADVWSCCKRKGSGQPQTEKKLTAADCRQPGKQLGRQQCSLQAPGVALSQSQAALRYRPSRNRGGLGSAGPRTNQRTVLFFKLKPAYRTSRDKSGCEVLSNRVCQ